MSHSLCDNTGSSNRDNKLKDKHKLIAGTAIHELRQSVEEAERRAVEVEQRDNTRVQEAEQRARDLEQRIQDAT